MLRAHQFGALDNLRMWPELCLFLPLTALALSPVRRTSVMAYSSHLSTPLRHSRTMREGQSVRPSSFRPHAESQFLSDVTIGLDKWRFLLRLNTMRRPKNAVGICIYRCSEYHHHERNYREPEISYVLNVRSFRSSRPVYTVQGVCSFGIRVCLAGVRRETHKPRAPRHQVLSPARQAILLTSHTKGISTLLVVSGKNYIAALRPFHHVSLPVIYT